MAVFALQLDDFVCSEYDVFAIHSTLEAYKLCYHLNQHLKTKLHYAENIAISKNGKTGYFERFFYDDAKQDIIWHLVANKTATETKTNSNSLFGDIDEVFYLLPEHKKIDFLLKIEKTENEMQPLEIIKKIQKIKTLSMVYALPKEQIKSKTNLIF